MSDGSEPRGMVSLARVIATVGPVGRVPVAPGTAGSAVAVPLAWGLHWAGGFPLLAAASVVVFALGVWAAARLPGGALDPPEIVIDEVAGQWLALWPLSGGLWLAGAAPHVFPWPGWVGAFLAFRLFDIWKPWPASRADALKTPLGVMLDDAAAGLQAAILVAAAAALAHLVILA